MKRREAERVAVSLRGPMGPESRRPALLHQLGLIAVHPSRRHRRRGLLGLFGSDRGHPMTEPSWEWLIGATCRI